MIASWKEGTAVLDGRSPGAVIHAKAEAALLTIPDDSVDAIVTDPPAGIGFMGKEWDDFRRSRNAADAGRENVFGRSSARGPEYARRPREMFIAWMTGIAAECLRVLKPGGHALVWAIPRTSHWTATAWEDAGFEVRDRISHLFGSGFPKSLDVGKAIDKAAGVERELLGRKICGDGRPSRMDADKNELRHEGYARPWKDDPEAVLRAHSITAPATDDAKQWDGWGTALKPACEDWWLLRKPLGEPTVAANVLKWGTGALNIDGCRIGFEGDDGQWHSTPGRGTKGQPPKGRAIAYGKYGDGGDPKDRIRYESKGRWPANVTHDGSPEVLAGFPETTSGGNGREDRIRTPSNALNEFPGIDISIHHGDSGSAARFFYCAKASRLDRGAGNTHPTVKNTALMEWLVKLITPPGGVVLDCFAGSGSTCVAAKRLGHRFIAIEQAAEYVEQTKLRLADGPLYERASR